MTFWIALALTALLPSAALAQAGAFPGVRSIADCEAIKGDLPYNQCLASFGPRRGERPARGSVPDAAAVDADDTVEAAAPATVRRGQRRGGRRALARRSRGGRVAAVFEVRRGGRSELSRRSAPRRSYRSSRRRR